MKLTPRQRAVFYTVQLTVFVSAVLVACSALGHL